jgi:hypothetical protein
MIDINIKKDRPSKLHWWHGYQALGHTDPKDITSDNNEKMPFNLSVQFVTFQCPKVLKEVGWQMNLCIWYVIIESW